MIMTKEQFAQFRKEIETALAPIADKYGTKVVAAGRKYDDITTDVTVSFRTETAEKSAEQLAFEKHAPAYGFKPEDFGFEFEIRDKKYTFVSFKTTARKYPCIFECSDGKQYAYEADAMLNIMKIERAKI